MQARQRGGPKAMTFREALWLATMGGARCLGRQDEIGSIEPGKLADLALWRLDGMDHAGMTDPVASLVFGPQPRLKLLLVGGETVVADDELRTAPAEDLARELKAASSRLIEVSR
jgi:cytosine/adenosine deaminase-related metal-dependent hydrolase